MARMLTIDVSKKYKANANSKKPCDSYQWAINNTRKIFMKFPNQFNSAAAYKNFVRYQKKQEKDWKNHTASAASLSSGVDVAYGPMHRAESEKKRVRTMPELGMIGDTDLSAKKRHVFCCKGP